MELETYFDICIERLLAQYDEKFVAEHMNQAYKLALVRIFSGEIDKMDEESYHQLLGLVNQQKLKEAQELFIQVAGHAPEEYNKMVINHMSEILSIAV